MVAGRPEAGGEGAEARPLLRSHLPWSTSFLPFGVRSPHKLRRPQDAPRPATVQARHPHDPSIATNMGVESTARLAREHGYNIVLVEDATSALSAYAQRFAFTQIFPLLARIDCTEAVINAITH